MSKESQENRDVPEEKTPEQIKFEEELQKIGQDEDGRTLRERMVDAEPKPKSADEKGKSMREILLEKGGKKREE